MLQLLPLARSATLAYEQAVPWRGNAKGCGSFPPEAVEAVLLWADPWLSARIFGGGLYALICFRHVAVGEQPLCEQHASDLRADNAASPCSTNWQRNLVCSPCQHPCEACLNSHQGSDWLRPYSLP
jgi:hypothetical protein